MSRFLVLFSVALLFSLFACQSNGTPLSDEESGADSLSYHISALEKNIGCEKEEGTCLRIKIERISVTSGTSEEASQAIQAKLNETLLHADNSSEVARSPEEIAANLEKEYARIIREMPDYHLPWNYQRTYKVYLNHNGLFGTTLRAYSFTGGAHEIEFTYHNLFDIDNGQPISWEELLIANGLSKLTALAEKQFREIHGIAADMSFEAADFWFEDNRFALPDNFKYTPEGLEIYWNVNEIAAYSEGSITLLFSYDQIRELIRPEYHFVHESEEV